MAMGAHAVLYRDVPNLRHKAFALSFIRGCGLKLGTQFLKFGTSSRYSYNPNLNCATLIKAYKREYPVTLVLLGTCPDHNSLDHLNDL